ncbi:MAG TPA: M14 family zinc carboxypeptidase [Candidatus Hydrogenedentes bacterium]|nr:M14 family zinc carboxypeptidase [Candidatus Hydrogenedentota bacterium]HPG66341.1 M14 family zinc carboxypeptidase [Candidatus Hydrogenedentota bacterium]
MTLSIVMLAGLIATTTAGTPAVSVVEIRVPDASVRAALIDGPYDVSNVRGDIVEIYATADEIAHLEADGFDVLEVAPQPNPRALEWAAKAALGEYHNYAALTDTLNAYATAHPTICRLYSLGKSVQNRDLWALRITDHPDAEEDEPEFKYVSTIHGDEPLGTELCLYLIDRLLGDYTSDARIADLVDSTVIEIVPLMNPDGREAGTRYNAHTRDLNRSFPVYPGEFSGTWYDGAPLRDAGREPEVACIMQWTAANSFTLSANLHTGSLVVNYPYDDDDIPSYYDAPSPDDELFENISERYSIHNTPIWNNPSFTHGITNGTMWYSISGGMQDWNYRYVSCNEVTLELSNTKWPSQSTLPGFWSDNEESMLSYIEAVHIGVRGVVTDGETGLPIWAEVAVAGNSHVVYTDPNVGDYHRMLLPGTYDVTVSADGYVSQTVTDILVADGPATRVDLALLDPDLDNDGTVGASDVQLVVNAILGYPVAHACDVDGGGVSATDLQTMINIVLSP